MTLFITRMWKTAAIFASLAMTATIAPTIARGEDQPLTIAKQGSFFVGGREVTSQSLSTAKEVSAVGTITVDQLYVHYQLPVSPKPYSFTLIHGCCLSGKTWETTPDDRMGWDEYFLRKGYAVYIVDQATRGRSAFDPSAINNVKLGKASPDSLPELFAAGHQSSWELFRFGPKYPQAFDGQQFPLDHVKQLWQQMVPDWNGSLPTPNPTIAGLSELSQKLNGTILVSHSESGGFPFQTLAAGAKGVAAIVAVEPGHCPAASDDMTPYIKTPTIILWGDFIEFSPFWQKNVAMCEAFAAAANKAGGNVQNISLPAHGFKGNSHMMMQDKNSQAVADWILAWVEKTVK